MGNSILKNAICFIVVTLLAFSSTVAQAVDVQVHAAITARAAISVVVKSEMNFGDITFDEDHSGTIRLATDGSVNLTGATGLELGGTATAGKIGINGGTAANIEVSCETSGLLSDGQANVLSLKDIEINFNTGVGPGMGSACSGLGNTALVKQLDGGASDLLIGGALDTTQTRIAAAGDYTTAAANGDPVTIRVVYQ